MSVLTSNEILLLGQTFYKADTSVYQNVYKSLEVWTQHNILQLDSVRGSSNNTLL